MDERTMWSDLGKNFNDEFVCGNVNHELVIGDKEDDIVEGCSPKKSQNYNRLSNKPSINGVELKGDLSSEDLGLDIADKNFIHNQTEASDTWIIVHNLNKYPAVSIIDSAGEEVDGNVIYNNENQVTIQFNGAFKGVASLN